MKKLLLTLLLIPVFIFCGCGSQSAALKRLSEETAAQINENTNLELKFLEDVKEKDFSFLVRDVGWEGADGYYNSGYQEGDIHYVQYVVTAYPDYADGGSVVTRITCTDPYITFFGGYTVNDSEELIEYLTSDGFKIAEKISDNNLRIKKGKITISFIENTEFKGIVFMCDISNRKGIVF